MADEPRVQRSDDGARGAPFGASLADLDALGYRQHEYLVEGTATRYRAVGELGFDGRWPAEPAGSAPFRTRLVVTAPEDADRFNGTVLAEWNNVSAGFEITLADDEQLFRAGFAHVGVSAQVVGVHGLPGEANGLVAWDPQRYDTLSIPGESYSYDIFTTVARLAGPDRPRGGIDVLGGLVVERLVAIGGSQSAARLATYVNAVQPLEGLFDGIVLVTYFGSGSSLGDDAILDLRERDGSKEILRPVGTRLRDDLPIPVMVVNSETETLPHAPVRQPDTERFRFWEVAGTAHATTPDMAGIVARIVRDGLELPAPPTTGDAPPMCEVSWKPVLVAALDHLQGWLRGGPPPPSQPPVRLRGEPPDIERDARGIALGGVRLPNVDVPLAAHTGVNGQPGMGVLNGASVPFPVEVSSALYPDGNAYLGQFDEALRRAVDAGVLLPTAAAALRQEAERDSHELPAGPGG